ncbi:MAG: chemotaxis protein CheX [Sporichthyaceae bacterium]
MSARSEQGSGTAGLGLACADLREMVDEVWSALFAEDDRIDNFTGDDPDAELPPLVGAVITATVHISGDWQGRVRICTTADGAAAITAALLDVEEGVLGPADLADAIGELANIVGGSVKSCVNGSSVLSLPVVVTAATQPNPVADTLAIRTHWLEYPIDVRVEPLTTIGFIPAPFSPGKASL